VVGAVEVDLDPDGCDDDRYPALAGTWIVGCSASGLVDLAIASDTGLRVVLSDAAASPGLAPGALYATGLTHGVWRLPASSPVRTSPLVTQPILGPPAFDGTHVALTFADGVEAFTLGDTVRSRISARPRPWYPPALAWPAVAWADETGLLARENVGGATRQLSTRVAAPLAFRGWFVWPGEGPVPAEAGFDAPITGNGEAVCWETRPGATQDVTIRCDDVGEPIPGTHPSRWGRLLLFRAQGRTWRLTLPTATPG
jgi:hypothetical protein